MKEIFRKRLTPSERQRHWIQVPNEARDEVPQTSETFSVCLCSKTYETYIDDYRRMRLGSTMFNEGDLDSPGTTVALRKLKEGFFEIVRL